MAVLSLLLLTALAQASEHGRAPAHESAPVHAEEPAVAAAEKKTPGPTVAMNATTGKAVRANEILAVGNTPVKIVDQQNAQIELAPHTVVEFNAEGQLQLLRGSALVESAGERSLATSSARLDFAGKVLLSYDHKLRSTSAFVVDGEARMVNPHQADRSLRLERFRGATLEVDSILPQALRQLDLASVKSWMKGYAWPEARTAQILRAFPTQIVAEERAEPEHLKAAKLEDYFSAIDTEEDVEQPDYYERKFADPDAAVAQAKSTKKEASRSMSPEEAALISLPSTQIDLGFEVMSGNEEALAQGTIELPRKAKRPAGGRSLASPKKPVAQKRPAVKMEKTADGSDPEVNEVLERLRGIRPKAPVISQVPAFSARSPASEAGVVPDPVYDFSENF